MKGKEYFYTGIHPATDCIAKQPVCDYMTMKFILLLCLNLVDTISIMCIHVCEKLHKVDETLEQVIHC